MYELHVHLLFGSGICSVKQTDSKISLYSTTIDYSVNDYESYTITNCDAQHLRKSTTMHNYFMYIALNVNSSI